MTEEEEKPERPDLRLKKYYLRLSTNQLVELHTQLRYDGIMFISLFIRMMIKGYLDQDIDLLKALTRFKKDNKILNSSRRKKSLRMAQEGKQTEVDFRLSSEEVANIYDLLEEDAFSYTEDFLDERMPD